MSTNSPRLLAATAVAAVALIASACSTGATETTAVQDAVNGTAVVDVESPDAPEQLTTALSEVEAVPEVLGETEDLADVPTEELVEPEVRRIDEAASKAAGERNAARAGEVLARMIALIESTEPIPIIDPADLVDDYANVEIEAVRYAIRGVDWGLNVRSGASADTELVTQVEKDRILTGTGLQNAEWVEIDVDGAVGWVRLEFLVETNAVEAVDPTPAEPTPETPAPEDTAEEPSTPDSSPSEPERSESAPDNAAPATLVVVDVTTRLNLRNGPGAQSDVVGGIPLGATVVATGNATNVWTEVTYDGLTGWARSDRLRAN